MIDLSAWQLRSDLDFLNHGSFGAVPRVVSHAQREIQAALESDPIEFLAPERSLNPRLDSVRELLASLLGADAMDIAFVRNATDGVNAVLRSFPLATGDEVIVTNHGYNACVNAARFVAERGAATVRVAEVPFPIASAEQVLEAIERTITPRSRLLLVDHVTSPTGLVFPLDAIVRLAHQHGLRVLVDGAHGPGMVNLDLRSIGADYYTANHHKWLCGPKVSGFLWVDPRWQGEVRPAVISHAANRPQPDRSRFIAEFDWTGTFDPSPLLALPTAIEFLASIHDGGLEALMAANRDLALRARDILAHALGIAAPAPDAMIGSLVAVPLPPTREKTCSNELDPLQQRLRQRHGFELPVFPGVNPDSRVLRISLQAYNSLDQITRLAGILRTELRHGTG